MDSLGFKPKRRAVEIFHLSKDAANPAIIYAEKDAFTCSFFPGLTFQVAEFFKQERICPRRLR
jgi:hypothetical protein